MKILKDIAKTFKAYGIESYFVGGCVRDEIMGLPVDDIDICLVGAKDRESINRIFDTVLRDPMLDRKIISLTREVGATFPVWILEIDAPSEEDDRFKRTTKIDFAMARTEKLIGDKRVDFEVNTSGVTLEEDLSRRDLTINAIAKNVITDKIIDPYLGIKDIEDKCARNVSKAFAEDTLRVIRAARFIARFDLTPTEHFKTLCGTLNPSDISNERVGMELMKVFKQADKPSKFFEFLRDVNWLQYHFQELKDLIGIPQSPKHHPEGDAFIHTMYCIDVTANWFFRTVMLCHDLGKATTTTIIDGKIQALGHEEASVSLGREMLKRIFFTNHKQINQICVLVKLHMIRAIITPNNYKKIVRRTLRELMDNELSYNNLCHVVWCDLAGRPPLERISKIEIEESLCDDYAIELQTTKQMIPIVTGKILIDEGFKPSSEFGLLIDKALELQDRGTLNKDN